MRFYLAARYSRLDELNEYAEHLRLLGHTVDARWLLGEHQAHDGALLIEDEADDIPDIGRLFAQDDIADIDAADVFVCFTERPRSPIHTRGGRHVEFGYALAKGKPIAVIGPRENVFYCLPQMRRFGSWPEFIASVPWSLAVGCGEG